MLKMKVILLSVSTSLLSVSKAVHEHVLKGVVEKKLQELLKTSRLYESSFDQVGQEIKFVHSVIEDIGTVILVAIFVAAEVWF